MSDPKITAIISYSHEGEDPAWMAQVRQLADLLESAGIDVELDQHHEHDGVDWAVFGPSEVMTRDWVLCLASPAAHDAWLNPASGSKDLGIIEEARATRSRIKRQGPEGITWVLLPGRTSAQIPPQQESKNYVAVPSLDASGLNSLLRRIDPARFAQPAPTVPRPGHGRILGALPVRNPHFTGREDLLESLAQDRSQRAHTVVRDTLAGTGGVGKTDLAIEHAYRSIDDGTVDWVGFFVADSAQALLDGWANIGAALGVTNDGGDPAAFARAVVSTLECSDDHWLLIIDNVEQESELGGLLPRVGSGQLVLTTRNRDLSDRLGARSLDVTVLPIDKAVELLRERAPSTIADDTLTGVAESVACLPLALGIAASLLRKGVPLDQLLTRLPTATATNREVTVASLWDATIEQLSDEAVRVLEICAACAPDAVPTWALVDTELNPPIDAADEAVEELIAWSLADPVSTDDGRAVSVHRLLHSVVRSRARRTMEASAADAAEMLLLAVPDDVSVPTSWPPVRTIGIHAMQVADLFRNAAAMTETLSVVLDRIGAGRRNAGDVAGSIEPLQLALTIDEQHSGSDAAATMSARAALAISYWSAGRLDEAIHLEEQTLADSERILGVDNPRTLTYRNNLATSYWSAGRLEEALQLDERNLADRERILGPDHPGVTISRNNLASSYRAAGRINEAVQLYERTLADNERILGPDHPDTLSSRYNLAVAYKSADRNNEAVQLYERTLADSERILGADHPDTIARRRDLGFVRSELAQHDRTDPPDFPA